MEHRAELKLSRHPPNCAMFDLFRDFVLAFFPIIESEISEQASRQVAIEEPEENRRMLLKREQIRKSSKEKQNRHSEF